MNRLQIGCLSAALSFAACTTPEVQILAGYTQVAVSGDLALAEGTQGTGGTAEQDVESAFGLGDEQGSPYVAAQFAFGGPRLGLSGFVFEESGQGVLEEDFGGLPAATPVASDLYFACAKISAVWDFPIGPVTLSPGVAFDVVHVDFSVEELSLGNREEIDEIVGVPMAFARIDAELGPVGLVGEIGYMEAQVDGSGGTFLDAETMMLVSPSPSVQFFAGYRYMDLDASGDTGSDSFRIDLQIRGWMVGGGFTF